MSMTDVMIDCETFGLHPQSAICTLGAVQFDPHTVGALGQTFHESIDLQSSINHGLLMDPDTVLWWLTQKDEARMRMVEKLRAGSSLSTVLGAFTNYLRRVGDIKDVTLWSCGSRDFEWLESSYRAVKMSAPWKYRTMDYRTIRELFGTKADEPTAGVSHDALSDAKWQVQYLQNVMARLRAQQEEAVSSIQAKNSFLQAIITKHGPVTLSSDEDHREHAAP